MGDISHKNLKRYEGKNLTIIRKSMNRSETSSNTCRKGVVKGGHFHEVVRHDVMVYQNRTFKTSRLAAKRFVRRGKVFRREQPNHAVLGMFFFTTGLDLWLIKNVSLDKTFTRMCGKQKITTERHDSETRRIGCIHVDRFLATIYGDNIYLRASVRTCTKAELRDYASRSTRGKSSPFYRYQDYSVQIMRGMHHWWPSLLRTWKKGRLISRRAIKW